MDSLIGRVLDNQYRLLQELGAGAMGTVYRAERMDGTGQAAVKVLQRDCSIEPELRERFEREARALFGLEHPHILDVQDYGVIDGHQPYLVMELLHGQSLDEMIDAGPLEPGLALQIARQFLLGLAHAHSLGVLHRDLKTENIFVSWNPDGTLAVKLLDFGLVKFTDDDRWGKGRQLTVAGTVMGSPAYMSPEQGTGSPMDARSDVYSSGVVLYELLTGDWPFVAETRTAMLTLHLTKPVPKVVEGRGDLRVRTGLDELIGKAMAKQASQRFANAIEMLQAFDALPQPLAWLMTAPSGSHALDAPHVAAAPPALTPTRDNRWIIIALIVAFVVGALGMTAAGLLAWLLLR